jgi:hypothetical protein
MVQLDGSHHDWFEGWRAQCVLRVMVDDSTGRLWAQFFEEETARAPATMCSRAGLRRQGVPRRLYVDRDSICWCEGLGSVTEQLAGQAPQTQFGRAMETLDVELILAHSPQAKGRVERMNSVLQDRLVKALRLAGINDLEGANRFLAETFLPVFNRKFNVMAASTADVHRGVPRELDEALSWEAARVVQRDWTVVSTGPATRGAESGGQESDRSHAAGWAGATGASGQATEVARTARTTAAGQAGAPTGGGRESVACGQSSVAPAGGGSGAGVLASGEGARTGDPRGGEAGGAGLRSASATLRPPSVPHRQPGKQSHKQQPTKGTFSRELTRGHF